MNLFRVGPGSPSDCGNKMIRKHINHKGTLSKQSASHDPRDRISKSCQLYVQDKVEHYLQVNP